MLKMNSRCTLLFLVTQTFTKVCSEFCYYQNKNFFNLRTTYSLGSLYCFNGCCGETNSRSCCTSTWMIVGGVCGAVIFAVIVGVFAIFVYKGKIKMPQQRGTRVAARLPTTPNPQQHAVVSQQTYGISQAQTQPNVAVYTQPQSQPLYQGTGPTYTQHNQTYVQPYNQQYGQQFPQTMNVPQPATYIAAVGISQGSANPSVSNQTVTVYTTGQTPSAPPILDI